MIADPTRRSAFTRSRCAVSLVREKGWGNGRIGGRLCVGGGGPRVMGEVQSFFTPTHLRGWPRTASTDTSASFAQLASILAETSCPSSVEG